MRCGRFARSSILERAEHFSSHAPRRGPALHCTPHSSIPFPKCSAFSLQSCISWFSPPLCRLFITLQTRWFGLGLESLLKTQSGNAARFAPPLFLAISLPVAWAMCERHQHASAVGVRAVPQANLQDYSYHMSKMVSLTPSQFCKAAEFFQQKRHIERPVTERLLAKPAIYEADLEHMQSSASDLPTRMAPPVKACGSSRRVCVTTLAIGRHFPAALVDAALSHCSALPQHAPNSSSKPVWVSPVMRRSLVVVRADGRGSAGTSCSLSPST